MISWRKTFLAILVLLILVAAAAIFPRVLPGSLNPSVTFVGWTSLSGRTCASLLLSPVVEAKPLKNFFFFQFYRARFDYAYQTEDGTTRTASFSENIGVTPHLPARVEVPVPTNAMTLEFVRVQSWIERRWDNARLPFNLPSRRFVLKPPLISGEQLNKLRNLNGFFQNRAADEKPHVTNKY
jgi:hypothetical protein